MEALEEPVASSNNDINRDSSSRLESGQQERGTVSRSYDAGVREDDPILEATSSSQGDLTGPREHISGREPVSGLKGEGTGTQPFDAGSLVDEPEIGSKSVQNTTSGDITPTAQSLYHDRTSQDSGREVSGTAAQSSGTATTVNSCTQGTTKTSVTDALGWFTNANPFAKGPRPSEGSAIEPTETFQEQDLEESLEAMAFVPKSMSPPNHLGEDVPPGQRAIVHEPVIDPSFMSISNNSNLPGDDGNYGQIDTFDRSKGKGKGRAPLVEDEDFSPPTEASSTASYRSERKRPESTVTDYTYPTAGTDASTIASSSRRSSGVMNIPHSKGKPITAGGVPLGLRAMQDREMRFNYYMPIYEHPEPDYQAHSKPDMTPTTPTAQGPDAAPRGPPLSTLRGSKRHDPVGVGEHAKKQPVTEGPGRRMSVMQKARSFGRKVKHSISS